MSYICKVVVSCKNIRLLEIIEAMIEISDLNLNRNMSRIYGTS